MRQPMEEVYGAHGFAKTWEAWVDGIAQFAKKPGGVENRNFLSIFKAELFLTKLFIYFVFVLFFIYRKYLQGTVALNQLSNPNRPRRKRPHGAKFSSSVPPQTHQRIQARKHLRVE